MNEVEIYTGDSPMWHRRLQDGLPEAALSILTDEQRSALASVFAHISKTPGLLAYTSSPEKGFRDIKPGRLLKKLCPDIPNELIKKFSSYFIDTNDARLEVTRSFAEVYTERYLSCMSKPFKELDHHPATVYNHPDNNIILLVVRDRTGTLLGRTLANSKTKQFVGIYFNHGVANSELITKKIIESAEYVENVNCLFGEKLQKLLTSDGQPICPYIDSFHDVITLDDCLVIGLAP